MSMPSQTVATPPPKKSGTSKFLLGCGGIFLVLCLLCCGIGGWGIYRAMNTVSKDPVVINEVAHKIADFDQPPFEPYGSINVSIPSVGDIGGALYMSGKSPKKDESKGYFGITQMPEGGTHEQLQNQIRPSIDNVLTQNGEHRRQFKTEAKASFDQSVNGKPGQFQVFDSVDASGEPAVIEILGYFSSKAGKPSYMELVIDAEDEKEAIDFVKSFK